MYKPEHHPKFARQFYGTNAWKKCRKAYKEMRGGLCERCLRRGLYNPGTAENPLQVHHKIPLTPENIKDPSIALNFDNLELLCYECHDEERTRCIEKRWTVDEDGNVVF